MPTRSIRDVSRSAARPARTWVFINEREDRVYDAQFVVGMYSDPASCHNRAGGLVFTDGRAEMKRWQDARTTPPLAHRGYLDLDVLTPNNPDVLWLMERSTRPLN